MFDGKLMFAFILVILNLKISPKNMNSVSSMFYFLVSCIFLPAITKP